MEIPIRRTRVSYEQRQEMLEFMMSHPEFARNKLLGSEGVRKKIELQTELSRILNSCATGPTKTSDKWIKCWQDWRSDVKAKAAKIRRAKLMIGDTHEPAPLSPLERSLMEFIGHEVAECVTLAENLERPTSTSSLQNDISQYDGNSNSFDAMPEVNNSETVLELQVPKTEAVFLASPERSPQASPLPSPKRPQSNEPTPFRRRRRRIQTPYDRSTNDFVALEYRRLALEESRLRDLHHREMERLRLESQRLEVDREKIMLLRTLTSVAKTWIQSQKK